MPTLGSTLHKIRKTLSSTYKKRHDEEKQRHQNEENRLRNQKAKEKEELYSLMQKIHEQMELKKVAAIHVPSGPVPRRGGSKRKTRRNRK